MLKEEPYSRLINALDGFEIRLVKANMNLDTPDAGEQKVSVRFATNVIDRSAQKFTVDAAFSLDSKDASSGEAGFSLTFTYRMTYSLSTDVEVNDELMQEFMSRNVPINIWPYAREFVSSCTSRMGLSPLWLDPLKIRV